MNKKSVQLWTLLAVLALLLTLPLTALAAPGDQYEVKGAGSTEVNGVYTEQVPFGWGGAQYTFVNGATTYYLCNDDAASPTQWLITTDCQSELGGGLYMNTSTSLTPPEEGWVTYSGYTPAPTVVPVVKGARITKSVTTAYRLVQPGETVTYTLKFTNSDTDPITGVVITDTLSADLVNASFTSSGATVTARAGAPYVWDISDLAAGQTGYITITAQVSGGAAEGMLNNMAEITASRGGQSSSAAFAVSWWQSVGPEDFFANINPYFQYNRCRLALDSNDVPYVACIRSNDRAEVQHYVNGAWEVVGAAGLSSSSIGAFDLALGSDDVPYVTYRDDANSRKATVMRYNGSAWVTVGSAGFSAGEIGYISLALDSANCPYVAYGDYANSNKATVMRYNGSAWETVGSAGFSAGAALYISLALDSSNRPYVAYGDYANSRKATVMRYNGSAWEPVGSAGFSADYATNTSLALDSNNVPYVAYEDEGNGSRATVMKFNGSVWEPVGSAGFSAEYATNTSLALDSNNVLYVAYRDGANSGKATVMVYTGSAWEPVGNAGFSAGDAKVGALVFDSTQRPYVVYWNNDNYATVMRHSPAPTTVTCTASANGNWSDPSTWNCGGAGGPPGPNDNVVIPSGVTITLDQDIELGGNLDVQGTLVPNGKTVTLTGDQAQTLKGSPPNMTFYNLVVNKTNASDTVTIDGKLKVTKKLTIKKGKLISASDYTDVVIEAAGTMQLGSDITVSGDWTNDGTFIPNGHTVTFEGTTLQTLAGGVATPFYRWVIAAGAQVNVVTVPTASDSVENNGELRQTLLVNNTTVNFLQISTDKYRGVDIATTDNLGDVTVSVKGNHAVCTSDPTSGPYRNRCFNITTASGSTHTDITFYTTATEDDVDNDIVFQWRSDLGMWVALETTCGGSDGDPCAVTSDALELFAGANHFLIGDDAGDTPTAITLRSLAARGAGFVALGLLALGAVAVALVKRRRS